MITFTDKRKYVKGTIAVTATNPATGDIGFYSDKVSNSALTVNVNMGEVRGGFLNPVATMIATDPDIQLELTTVDFSMRGLAAQTGARLSQGAPKMVCQTVTASGAALSVDVTKGTPVARLGMDDVICYVQEVGQGAPLSQYGAAYPLNAASGAITGFSAVSGHTYKVWYFVNRANAELATLTTAMEGGVWLYDFEMGVFENVNLDTLSGTRVGTLTISVLMKNSPSGTVGGNQTDVMNTTISARALPNDPDVIAAGCNDCGGENPLAYFCYVPCDTGSGIAGLALPGGVITVAAETTHVVSEFRLVTEGNQLVAPDPAFMSYELSGAPTGTSISGNVITAGATSGSGEITGTYTNGGVTYTCPANLSVSA